MAFSSVAIAVFGFFVWAHHMFIMGISNYAVLVFSLLTMLVAVPSAIKIFNWTFTLYKGSITFETPMPSVRSRATSTMAMATTGVASTIRMLAA